MNSRAIALALCAAALGVAGAGFGALHQGKKAAKPAGKTITTKSGLKYTDITVGKGPSPKPGQTVTVNYTGWLDNHGKQGKQFDTSIGRGPFEFPIGQHRVIAGWDEGVMSMHVGGMRRLTIPPTLGYGASGTPDGTIPPNSTLIFNVQLLGVK